MHTLQVPHDGLRYSIVECLRLSCADDDTLTVKFVAEKVKRLSDMDRLTFSQGKSLVSCLEAQIKQLNAHGFGFVTIELDDVLCIDDQFVVVNDSHIASVFKRKLYLCEPVNTEFLAPEVKSTHELPAYLHIHTPYYSIGCILRHFNLTDWKFKGVLTRCMNPNVDLRMLYWI